MVRCPRDFPRYFEYCSIREGVSVHWHKGARLEASRVHDTSEHPRSESILAELVSPLFGAVRDSLAGLVSLLFLAIDFIK